MEHTRPKPNEIVDIDMTWVGLETNVARTRRYSNGYDTQTRDRFL